MKAVEFCDRLIAWQRIYGRHDLPWQVSDPYRIWLSEIMLQQTQVTTVLSYYERFLKHFPTLPLLANASIDEVLAAWSGLGYYKRAHHLHNAAQVIMSDFGGVFPLERKRLESLPGIGRSTAAAIAVFAAQQKEAILDGNVKRVLARVFLIERPLREQKTQQYLWRMAEKLLPTSTRSIISYTQGLMDLGATICRGTKPLCPQCPFFEICQARLLSKVTQIPMRLPTKKLMMRPTFMLLASYNDKIYLERRIEGNIWKGLFSLPEHHDIHVIKGLCDQLGSNTWLPKWPCLKHTFTHFHWLITPQPVKIIERKEKSATVKGQWFEIEEAMKIGIPAPIKALLIRLEQKLAQPD